jgi:hypothetical protein
MDIKSGWDVKVDPIVEIECSLEALDKMEIEGHDHDWINQQRTFLLEEMEMINLENNFKHLIEETSWRRM